MTAESASGTSPARQQRPWLAQYPVNLQADYSFDILDGLSLFRASVQRRGREAFIRYFDGVLSYDELDAQSDALAAHLHRRGVQAGDRVALMLQNTPQFPLVVLAAWKLRAIPVPINPMYRMAELRHVLTDCEPTSLVFDTGVWQDVVQPVLAELGDAGPSELLSADPRAYQTRDDPRIFGPEPVPGMAAAEDLAAVVAACAGEAVTEQTPHGDDVAVLSYTSGTSGVAKAAMNSHRNVSHNAQLFLYTAELSEGARIFVLAPLFHITGMVSELGAAITAAGTIVMTYRFEPGVVLDALAEHEPNFMSGPGTAIMALMAHPQVTPAHFAPMEVIGAGGAPLPPTVVDRFQHEFGPYMINGYGLTETSAPCVQVPLGAHAPIDPRSGTLSIGVPNPGVVVRIVDDAGSDLPYGEEGEIVVSGPMVVRGYWNRPEETAEAMPDGWLRTGDVGVMDPEGWIYLVDRKKDMINASGFKVWPREVEDVLYTHAAVREAAVVGAADAYRGETVHAAVSLHRGSHTDADELIAHCRERLAAYKCPRAVEFRADLPKNATGKVLRRELRE